MRISPVATDSAEFSPRWGSGAVHMLESVRDSGQRQALSVVLRGSAVPYGYTLTVLAAHSILANRHGGPDVAEILVFVSGRWPASPAGGVRAAAAAAGAAAR